MPLSCWLAGHRPYPRPLAPAGTARVLDVDDTAPPQGSGRVQQGSPSVASSGPSGSRLVHPPPSLGGAKRLGVEPDGQRCKTPQQLPVVPPGQHGVEQVSVPLCMVQHPDKQHSVAATVSNWGRAAAHFVKVGFACVLAVTRSAVRYGWAVLQRAVARPPWSWVRDMGRRRV